MQAYRQCVSFPKVIYAYSHKGELQFDISHEYFKNLSKNVQQLLGFDLTLQQLAYFYELSEYFKYIHILRKDTSHSTHMNTFKIQLVDSKKILCYQSGSVGPKYLACTNSQNVCRATCRLTHIYYTLILYTSLFSNLQGLISDVTKQFDH